MSALNDMLGGLSRDAAFELRRSTFDVVNKRLPLLFVFTHLMEHEIPARGCLPISNIERRTSNVFSRGITGIVLIIGLSWFLTIAGAAETAGAAGTAGHPPLLVASYTHRAAYVITADDRVVWEAKVSGSCQDAWLLPDGNVLLSGGRQVKVVRPDRSTVWQYEAAPGQPVEIHSCQPLPDGGVLFGEGGPDRLVELDRNGKEVRSLTVTMRGNAHDQMRQVRKLADGGYLVCAKGENTVYRLRADGSVVRRLTAEDMKRHGVTWNALHSAMVVEEGRWLIGGGYNSSFVEVDSAGAVVWQLAAADVPACRMTYAAGCQRLADGITVIAAYNSGTPIFAVSRDKRVLWTCSAPGIGHPTHVKVLTEAEAARFVAP